MVNHGKLAVDSTKTRTFNNGLINRDVDDVSWPVCIVKLTEKHQWIYFII